MAEFNFDFKAMLEGMMLHSLEKESPEAAAPIRVLVKKGYSVTDAVALLMELAAAVEAASGKEGENDGI